MHSLAVPVLYKTVQKGNGVGMPDTIITVAVIVVGVLVILMAVLSMWKKVPQDKAGVVTGMKKRVITGGGGMVIPVFERIDYISLGNIPLSVRTNNGMSSQGVPISVVTTAVIKVRNESGSILTAIEQFTGKNEVAIIKNINDTATSVLEGKLREIIATMTVEELYQKRETFSSKVLEVVGTELGNMGLEVKNFTITDISDENGYIKSLGEGEIARKRKDAEIAKAEAAREQDIKTSEAKKEGEQAKLLAETQIAEARKEKALRESEFLKEQETAKAIADAAYNTQKFVTSKQTIDAQMEAELLRQQKQKDIADAEIQIQIISEEKNIELENKRAEKKKQALRAEVVEPAMADKERAKAQAEAEKFRKIAEAEAQAEARKKEAEAESEAIRLKGLAEAETIRAKTEAEAEGIKAKGVAEAEAMEKKAEAYQKYTGAAMAEMVIKVLPDIAGQYAKQFAQIDKITVIQSGAANGQAGTDQVMQNLPSAMLGLMESMKDVTGIDLQEIIKANSYDAKVTKNVNITGLPKQEKETAAVLAEKTMEQEV